MKRRTGSIQKRGENSYRIRYTDIHGKRQEETIKCASEEDAQNELTLRLSEVACGVPISSKITQITFEEICANVVIYYKTERLGSVDDIEARFRLHLIPFFKPETKVVDITTDRIRAYIAKRRGDIFRRSDKATGKPVSDGTIQRELESLKRAFNLAIEDGKILHIPAIPRAQKKNAGIRKGFFSRAEVDRVCAAFPKSKHLQAVFVKVAFLTGWRTGELQMLKWEDIDFDLGEIRLNPGTTKNSDGRVFPMTDELRALLMSILPKMVDAANVTTFPSAYRDKPLFPFGDFRKAWARACKKAGLPVVIDKKTKAIKAAHLLHDLRRSAARDFVRIQGLSEMEAMLLTGHKTRSVFDRYSVVSTTDLEDIRTKLNRAKGFRKAGGE